jgi:bacterial/archaeal transporter family protein
MRRVSLRAKTMSWLPLTFGAVLAFGVWGVASKLALRSLSWGSVLGCTACVYLIATVILASSGKVGIHIGRDLGWAIVAGACGAIALVCFYGAISAGGDVSTVAAISAVYPAVTFILAVLFLGDSLTLTKAAGIALVVGGVVLLSVKV